MSVSYKYKKMKAKFHPVQAVPGKYLANSKIRKTGCRKFGIPSVLYICLSIICWAQASLLFSACSARDGWSSEEKAIIGTAHGALKDANSPVDATTPPMRVLTIEDAEDSLFLRQQCKDFTPEMLASPEFAALSELLLATVQHPTQDGVGIAGPQVGISRRVVAVQRFDKPGEPFEVYPNVQIVGRRGELSSGPEGCLSVPGLRGSVLRYRDIDIQYTLVSPAGSSASNSSAGRAPRIRPALRDTTERIQGFTAVIFQHECDHLEGVLYIDKVIPGSLQERD